MEFTNVSRGPRGLNTKHGQVIVAPGQTVDVEIDKVEADGALATKWFVKGGAPTEEAGDDLTTLKAQLAERDETIEGLNKTVDENSKTIDALKAQLAAAQAPAQIKAEHHGGGKFNITQGETVLSSGLSKADADAFNALDDEGKAKWLKDHPAA